MSKPKTMSQTIGFRLKLDDHAIITERAQAVGVSVGEYLRRIATAFAKGQLVAPNARGGDMRSAAAAPPGGHAPGHDRPAGDTPIPIEAPGGTRPPAPTPSSDCPHRQFDPHPVGRRCKRCGAISRDQGRTWMATEAAETP